MALSLVRQKSDMDCGIAALAMVHGVEYSDVVGAFPHACHFRGVHVAEMIVGLERMGACPWHVHKPQPYKPLAELVEKLSSIAGPALLIVRKASDKFGHWVAYEGGVIYDPEHQRPRAIGSYGRRGWNLIRVLTPTPMVGKSARSKARAS